MNKKTLTRVLIGLILITLIVTTIVYNVLVEEKPNTALFVACCGGVIVFNFLISLFLIIKNFKK